LKLLSKRFEKEKKRLQKQYEKKLEEERHRWTKKIRLLEKEQKRFKNKTGKDLKVVSMQMKKTARKQERSIRVRSLLDDRQAKAKLKTLLQTIRNEKKELLLIRAQIQTEREILHRERKGLEKDRGSIQRQRTNVIEAFAESGLSALKKVSKREKQKIERNGEDDCEMKEVEPTHESEAENEIGNLGVYSFFTEEQRQHRKEERHRLVQESWQKFNTINLIRERFSLVLEKTNKRLHSAIKSHDLLVQFWKLMDVSCKNVHKLEDLIPDLKSFAVIGVEADLFTEDYETLGTTLKNLLGEQDFWDKKRAESWNWCWDLLSSTLATSHELEVAKRDLDLSGDEDFNLADLKDEFGDLDFFDFDEEFEYELELSSSEEESELAQI